MSRPKHEDRIEPWRRYASGLGGGALVSFSSGKVAIVSSPDMRNMRRTHPSPLFTVNHENRAAIVSALGDDELTGHELRERTTSLGLWSTLSEFHALIARLEADGLVASRLGRERMFRRFEMPREDQSGAK